LIIEFAFAAFFASQARRTLAIKCSRQMRLRVARNSARFSALRTARARE